jgi:hypothetical protein
MALADPKTLIVHAFSASRAFHGTYTEPVFGLTQNLDIRVVSFDNGPCNENGAAIIWNYVIGDFSPDDMMTYVNMKNLIASCIANAEFINAEFFAINTQQLGKTAADFALPGSTDFMTLKNNIVSFVKRDVETKNLLSKDLIVSLEHYVTYRNIFTHGHLYVLVTAPEGFVDGHHPRTRTADGKIQLTYAPGRVSRYDWYISSRNKKNETVFIKLTKDIFQDYIQVYESTRKFIAGFRSAKPYIDPWNSLMPGF